MQRKYLPGSANDSFRIEQADQRPLPEVFEGLKLVA